MADKLVGAKPDRMASKAVIAYLLGDEKVSEGALSYEAAAMLPDVRRVIAA